MFLVGYSPVFRSVTPLLCQLDDLFDEVNSDKVVTLFFKVVQQMIVFVVEMVRWRLELLFLLFTFLYVLRMLLGFEPLIGGVDFPVVNVHDMTESGYFFQLIDERFHGFVFPERVDLDEGE